MAHHSGELDPTQSSVQELIQLIKQQNHLIQQLCTLKVAGPRSEPAAGSPRLRSLRSHSSYEEVREPFAEPSGLEEFLER